MASNQQKKTSSSGNVNQPLSVTLGQNRTNTETSQEAANVKNP